MADDRLACCLPASMLVSSCDTVSCVSITAGMSFFGQTLHYSKLTAVTRHASADSRRWAGAMIYCELSSAPKEERSGGRRLWGVEATELFASDADWSRGTRLHITQALTKKDSYHSRRRSCRVSNDAAS